MGRLKSAFKTGLKSTADLCTLTGLLCLRLRLKHLGHMLCGDNLVQCIRSIPTHGVCLADALFAARAPKCRGTCFEGERDA